MNLETRLANSQGVLNEQEETFDWSEPCLLIFFVSGVMPKLPEACGFADVPPSN